MVGGCTTVQDELVSDVGIARLVLLDPDLATQAVSSFHETIQVAEWTVEQADLTIDDRVVSLTFGEMCKFTDTALIGAFSGDKCGAGIVLDADGEARPVTLDLRLTMKVRRAEPLALPAGDDFDGDGVPNGLDNCPLVDNPDQADFGSDGFGDACTLTDIFSGAVFLDSDGDRIPDSSDNCPHVPNPGQENTPAPGEENIADGIGDACNEQSATVSGLASGNPDIELSRGPVDLLQPLQQSTYLIVDFSNEGDALVCNWEAGTCTLDETMVRFCVSSVFVFGCP